MLDEAGYVAGMGREVGISDCMFDIAGTGSKWACCVDGSVGTLDWKVDADGSVGTLDCKTDAGVED